MALLTAEDVLNKAFSKTKYREGFDQDEVDDFLDEVANTIAALTAERDELANRLAQGGGAPVGVVEAPATTGGSLLAAATDPNPPSATSMLAMAQKLHDEYVQAGEAEKEKILDQARRDADEVLRKAEADAKSRVSSLDAERAEAERAIDDLRRFERDYRSHLRGYLENLLGDLEHNAARGAAPALGAGLASIADASAPAADVADEPEEAVEAEVTAEAEVEAEPAVTETDEVLEPEEPWTSVSQPVADEPTAPGAVEDPVPAWPLSVPAETAPVADVEAAPVAEVTVPEWPAAPAAASAPVVPQWPDLPSQNALAAPAGSPEADLELTLPTATPEVATPSEPFPGAPEAVSPSEPFPGAPEPAKDQPEWPPAPGAGGSPFAPVNPPQ